MVLVSSCGAKISAPSVKPRGRFAGLLFGRRIEATVAGLMLFGCLNLSGAAYAQTPANAQPAASPDACVAKCTADHDKCINDQSSPELCAYELKSCKAACEKK